MKLFRFLLLLISVLFLNSINLKAQTENYFPLAIGNQWQQFNGDYYFFGEIERDTVMPNGKKYFVISRNIAPFENLRMDSLGNLYAYGANFLPKDSTEVIALKYDAKPGDRWVMDIKKHPFIDTISSICLSIKTGNVFGKVRKIKEIMIYNSETGNFPILTEFYADGIGIIHEEGFEGSFLVLNYAKINGVTYGQLADVEEKNSIPAEFSVSQNYPNPFNGRTIIEVKIPSEISNSSELDFTIFDILGRAIYKNKYQLTKTRQMTMRINLDADDLRLSSGTYFYSVRAGKTLITKKMTYLK